MSTLAVVVLAALPWLVVGGIALARYARQTHDAGLKAQVGKRIVVHTRDGTSIRGILKHLHRDCIVLDRPVHLGENALLAGDAIVYRSNVDWFQSDLPEAT